MRKTKQIVTAALAAIMAVGALTGCSEGNTTSGGKTAETTVAGSTSRIHRVMPLHRSSTSQTQQARRSSTYPWDREPTERSRSASWMAARS